MKITKIENWNVGQEDKIIVTVEGYPHSQPIFPADTKPEDLPALLKAWAKNQDEVDAINEAAKNTSPKQETDISALKALEGTDITKEK